MRALRLPFFIPLGKEQHSSQWGVPPRRPPLTPDRNGRGKPLEASEPSLTWPWSTERKRFRLALGSHAEAPGRVRIGDSLQNSQSTPHSQVPFSEEIKFTPPRPSLVSGLLNSKVQMEADSQSF